MEQLYNSTIAAISTAMSNSGIGIVRMSGPEAFQIADRVYKGKKEKKLCDQKSHTIHYGYIVDGEQVIDEVLVMLMRGPHSYTGEDTVEINCHGGVYVVKRILELLIKNGARPAEPGEYTKRAFLNGRLDLSQAEAVGDLIASQNEYALQSSVSQLKGNIKNGCIITDVGSVKTDIHEEVTALAMEDCFIGGHPMAGSERIGFANSKAGLLENAYYILAPAPQVPAAKIAEFQGLVTSMGAIPLQVESQKHDYVTAAVSHLPHIVAAALVHLVQDHDDAQGLMKSIAAGGFKDITRIASSSPVMWEQICMTNTVNISRLLQDYIDALGVVQKELQEHDSASLYTFFDGARAYRDSFIDAGSGPIKKDYSIRLDIPDEAGSIAAVSTLLALNNISIKNIGIVHNREAQELSLIHI